MFFNLEVDSDSILLGILSVLLSRRSLAGSREKKGVSRVLSVATGILFALGAAAYFFAAVDAWCGDEPADEELEEE